MTYPFEELREIRRKRRLAKIEKIKKLYSTGMTLEEIGKEFNCTKQAIWGYLNYQQK